MWVFLSRNPAIGQLLLRMFLGAICIYAYGWENLAGGMAEWRKMGTDFKAVGITFWLPFWGFMATMAWTLGMLLFIVGFAFRPACLFISLILIVLMVHDYKVGGLKNADGEIILLSVFFSMIFIGPGKYSVDKQ